MGPVFFSKKANVQKFMFWELRLCVFILDKKKKQSSQSNSDFPISRFLNSERILEPLP